MFTGANNTLRAETFAGRNFRETEKSRNLANLSFAEFSFRREFMDKTFANFSKSSFLGAKTFANSKARGNYWKESEKNRFKYLNFSSTPKVVKMKKNYTLSSHSESSSLSSAITSVLFPHNMSNSSGEISAMGRKCWLPTSGSPSRIGSMSLKGSIGGSCWQEEEKTARKLYYYWVIH